MSITECGSLQAVRLLEQGDLDIAMASVATPPDERFQTLQLRQSPATVLRQPQSPTGA
jgi:hypothetical protein